jgi:SAM-dependent methyltransferase
MYEASEMMFGLRDRFKYFQCSQCGCLQISEIPANMDKYYPAQYYSFTPKARLSMKNPVEKTLRRFRDYHTVFNRGILGRLISSISPNKKMTALGRLNVTTKSRVLDVGCGDGWRLNVLRAIGFETLLGIDPYIPQDITYENGVTIKKRSIYEETGAWDLIMYHHSFEHVPDPHEQLQRVAGLLSSGGCCLLRLPTVSSFAWEQYRENWFQLDAPRHFFLHSIESIKFLAEKAGLSLQDIVFDSTADQFQGSELYKRDIPFIAQAKNFTKSQVREWKNLAKKLNKEKRGDQAAFYLIKK